MLAVKFLLILKVKFLLPLPIILPRLRLSKPLKDEIAVKNSGSKKIAERYVSALFDVAVDAGVLEAVEKDLQAIASILENNADFRAFIINPLLTRNAQEQVAAAVLSRLNVNKITAQFIALLARAKRLDILGEMIALFLEAVASARGEMAAELVSAKPVSGAESKKIAEKLGAAYNKKITLTTRADASLLGGVIINVGSVQLDGSLAGKLNRLKTALRAA